MGKLAFDRCVGGHFTFGGFMGNRVEANLHNWLLTAPDANPGMIEMFRLRDREPVPSLVPWAGEFVGKYLISAIQARRMTQSKQLDELLQRVIADLISTQAEDGYLGPFRKDERLLGHWDLWGHYHCMLALMMWYEDTGDASALQCAVRCADLICETFLDTDRRVLSAGSPEMNMAVIHSLGWLYRQTKNESYFRMMREIEKDWESAGDYFRTGLEGKEFFRTPKPRWESLHDLQGLVELYRITGNEDYKKAFVNHWWSIAHYDLHNTGGFSTGEQAIGNPYSPGAIETCCTTAWTAITVDMLRMTGNSIAADELELSTWNSVLGSQHPSGRWWTYDTPMDGSRKASPHAIVFQARVGTPELNCCSVNAPRGIGALSEWAVMLDDEGPVVNYYGPSTASIRLRDGTDLQLRQVTKYPTEGNVKIELGLKREAKFNLRLRIPFWSKTNRVAVNGAPVADVHSGSYLHIERAWKSGDSIELQLDVSLRHRPGEHQCAGKASLYYGPLLLAFDQHFNTMDTHEIPPLDLQKLDYDRVDYHGRFQPIVLLKMKSADEKDVTLCDFATAGAYGTHYNSWLPATKVGPAPFYLKRPDNGERIGDGPIRFEWTALRRRSRGDSYTLVIAKDSAFKATVAEAKDSTRPSYVLRRQLEAGDAYYWKVIRQNENGSVENEYGPRAFVIDPTIESKFVEEPEEEEAPLGPGELIAASKLDGDGTPAFGNLELARNIEPTADRHGKEGGAVRFNGRDSKLQYKIAYFPEDEYTFYAWVCPEGLPINRLAQIFSAWAAGMDDPLRVVIQGDSVFARIEAGSAYGSKGVKLENGKWAHIAAVKQGERLSLFVDGFLRETADVPPVVYSIAERFAIGANPNFAGNEYFAGRIDDFALYARALTAEEIAGVYAKSASGNIP